MTTRLDARTKSAEDTRELGVALATLATPGDVVLLAGDLGAGKTTFAQGFARGLGVEQRVTSPTFVLMQHYRGRLPLVHIDVYRLDHVQEVVDLGLSELLDDGVVALVEWGDVVAHAVSPDFLEVRFEYGSTDDERDVALRLVGPRWAPRNTAVQLAVERWCVT